MSEPVRRLSGGFKPQPFLFSVLHINSSLLRVKVESEARRRGASKKVLFYSLSSLPLSAKCSPSFHGAPSETSPVLKSCSTFSPRVQIHWRARSQCQPSIWLPQLSAFCIWLLFFMQVGNIGATVQNTLADMYSKDEKKHSNQVQTGNLEMIFAKTALERHLFIASQRVGCLLGRGRR